MKKISVVVNENILAEFSRRRIFFAGKIGVKGVKVGDVLNFDQFTEIEPYTSFNGGGRVLCSMGAFSYSQSALVVGLKVGRYCSIASGFEVIGKRHPIEAFSTSHFTYTDKAAALKAALDDDGIASIRKIKVIDKPMPVIENDVWIGANVTLSQGIVVGTGSVIAAHSVVTKSVPPYAIVGGNPAKIIRSRFSPSIVERLLKSSWWEYKFTSFQNLDFTDPMKFCDDFEQFDLNRYIPNKITAEVIQNIARAC